MTERWWVPLFGAFLLLAARAGVSALPDPGAQAADYYFAHYDYAQAFSLWNSVFQRQPDSVPLLLRLSELRLMYEGHPAVAKGILDYLAARQATLPRESRRAIQEKLAALQSVFLTDEGQSAFLQGLARARRSDCTAALPFFSQADSLEKGNVRVLREKAFCERHTGANEHQYASWKLAHELDPFDNEVLDGLSEAFLYYQENQQVLELLQRESDGPRSKRQRTSQAVALCRSGATAPAVLLLQALIDDPSGPVPPIVYFEIGKAYGERPDRRGQAVENLKRFLALTQGSESVIWDPYHTRERVAEAQQLLLGKR